MSVAYIVACSQSKWFHMCLGCVGFVWCFHYNSVGFGETSLIFYTFMESIQNYLDSTRSYIFLCIRTWRLFCFVLMGAYPRLDCPVIFWCFWGTDASSAAWNLQTHHFFFFFPLFFPLEQWVPVLEQDFPERNVKSERFAALLLDGVSYIIIVNYLITLW